MDTAHTIQRILHQPPGQKRVLRLLPAIAAGLGIFVVMCAIPVGLGFVSHALGMAALVVLALAGLSLGYRAGALSILGATFVALLPAAMAVIGVDDFKTARRINVAEVSVAEAPRRGDAQVLVLTDARAAAEFTYAWAAPPTNRGVVKHYAIVPLVPPEWQRGMPVPAWHACWGGDAAWCEKALAYPVRATQRLTESDAAAYRPAILEVARRFGVTSAPGAPLLYLTTPPSDRADGAVTGMVFMPILGFVVWLLGLLLWRGVRRLRGAVVG